MRNKLKTKEFIEKAVKKHGDTYDYTETVYVTSKKKVGIVCREHGVFWQTPNSHLAGAGCRKCGEKKRGNHKSKRRRRTTKQFIEKAISKFGNLFDYSETDYSGSTKPVIIICKKHGRFEQTPTNHLSNTYGCYKCFLESAAETRRKPFYESPNRTLSHKEKRAFITNKMREIKEQTPCKDCGKNYPHYVLDFDHVRGDKISGLSELCAGTHAWEKIKAEMDKCDVVCSNCHRARTWNRINRK